MSSLRSSRGHASVMFDRLRYGSTGPVQPGVLAMGPDGVVVPSSSLNVQSLNVSGTGTIGTAIINTLIIDDVEFRTVSAIDFHTQTLEVTGTGTVNYLTVGGITGSTGTVKYLSVGGITGTTGTFDTLTVRDLFVTEEITDVGHQAAYSGDYIAGQKIRAGDESAANAKTQSQALYVVGNARVEGGVNCSSVNVISNSGVPTVAMGTGDISIEARGDIKCANLNAVGTISAINNTSPGTVRLLSDFGGTGAVDWIYDGEYNERVYMSVYPKPTGNTRIEVESTPLIAGIMGPAGVIGAIGDKYINQSLQVGGSLIVTGGATAGSFATSGAMSASTVYTDTISPYPSGSTGILGITTGIAVSNTNTSDPSGATTLSISQTDGSGSGSITWYHVGQNANRFGGTPNDQEQFCLYSYPKTGSLRKVESTPLKTGTVGPAGVTGAVGDKYFYGSVQAAGGVYGSTGSFQNVTVNGLLTLNGAFVYGVQVI